MNTSAKPFDVKAIIDSMPPLSPALALAGGMFALMMAPKIINKMLDAVSTTAERKKRRRIRAARKVTPYSVKRWKAAR